MREATAAEKSVFGANVQIGEDDRPVEMGFGSPAKKSQRQVRAEAAAEAAAKEHQAKLQERAELEKAAREQEKIEAEIKASTADAKVALEAVQLTAEEPEQF